MPLNLKELDQVLSLMAKHNVRFITLGDTTISKDTAPQSAPTQKTRKTPKDPLDELLELTGNHEEE